MIGLGGGGGSSSSQSHTFIDPIQQQYLSQIYGRASELSNQPRSFYPGSTVAPFSAETEAGLGATASRARTGNPLLAAGENYAGGVLRGDYLRPESNPYLSDTYNAAARGVVSQFKRSVLPGASLGAYGRGGSGREANRQAYAYDQVLGRNLNDLATSIYGGNYDRERGMQAQTARDLPMYSSLDYEDSNRLRDVGATREDLANRQLQDLMARFYFAQDDPRNRLSEYAQLIGSPQTLSYGKSHASNWNANLSVLGG